MFDTVLLMLHAGGGVSAKPRNKAVAARPPGLSRGSLRRLVKARSRRKRNSWSGFRG